MHQCPPLFAAASRIIPSAILLAFASGIMLHASQSEIVYTTTLKETTVSGSSLQEDTRRFAGLGTRDRNIDMWTFNGIVLSTQKSPHPSLSNAFLSPNPEGLPTDKSWYYDYIQLPSGRQESIKFREPFFISHRFSNGVTRNLKFLPVFHYTPKDESWDYSNNLLLDFAYTGEVVLDGVEYIVDVVLGATTEYLERWAIPGNFDGPGTNVFLYRKATGERVHGDTRTKLVNGKWYHFTNNPSGELLTVSQINNVGEVVVDAGNFLSDDFSFVYGTFNSAEGYRIHTRDIVAKQGRFTLPAAEFSFDRYGLLNNGHRYDHVWDSASINGITIGKLNVADIGETVFTLGKNVEVRFNPLYLPPGKEGTAQPLGDHRYGPLDVIMFEAFLFDADTGAAIRPRDVGEEVVLTGIVNSNDVTVSMSWASSGCGWNGAYSFYRKSGSAPRSYATLPVDTAAPAVLDNWTVKAIAPMKGLYGTVELEAEIPVENKHFGMQVSYYKVDGIGTSFPDLDHLMPVADAHVSLVGSQTIPDGLIDKAWPSAPDDLTEHFAARYDFEWWFRHSKFMIQTAGVRPGDKVPLQLTGQLRGALRVLIDDKLVFSADSYDEVKSISHTFDWPIGSIHSFRIDYHSKSGEPVLYGLALTNTLQTYGTTNYPFSSYSPMFAPVRLPVVLNASSQKVSLLDNGEFSLTANASSVDGIAALEYYLDGRLIGSTDGSSLSATLSGVTPDSVVDVRAVNTFGYGSTMQLKPASTDGGNGSSDQPSKVNVVDTILEEKSVFDLSEETRKMALRGTREASVEATIAGRNLPLENTRPIVDYPGASKESSWYIDPYGATQAFTAFREAYEYRFDFGNGVVKNLRIVPVRIYNGDPKNPTGAWRDNVLLDLAYAGQVDIDGVRYLVEVVQGAFPDFKDRLSYPGFFNSPNVNVLLYHAETGKRVAGLGRIKKINGVWYEFLSNPSGEKLVVNRLNSTGVVRIDTGKFPQVDFAFTNGRIESQDGWSLSLAELDFSDGKEEIPATEYTFTEFVVRNNGQLFTFVWHPDFGMDHGSLTVPAGGVVDMPIGKSAKVELGFDPRYNYALRSFYNNESLQFRIFDADLGGAVIATDSQPFVSSYRNSNGIAVNVPWKLKPCGWDGKWFCYSDQRDYPSVGSFIVGPDTRPPAVEDTRTITMTSLLKGLFGNVSKTISFRVRNETYRLHGRFYDFDKSLEDFPNFDKIAPDLELPNAHMGMDSTEPWDGLPGEMADTFAACYEFDFSPNIPVDKDPTNFVGIYHFDLTVGGGAARVFVDGKLMLEAKNFADAPKTFKSSDFSLEGPAYRRVRVEYYHNTGAATLTLFCQGKIPPYYTYTNQFDPDNGDRFVALNPVYLPAKFDVTGTWRGGKTFVLQGKATSPDGIAKVEYFVDGVLAATTDGPDLNTSLTSVNVGSEVVLRAVDVHGFGTLVTLPVEGESLEEWMERYGLSDPDSDADGDGVSNREEYLAGTVPLPPAPFEFMGPTFEGNKFSLRWVGDKVGSKLVDSYQIEISEDLKTWKPHGSRLSLREDALYSVEIPTGNSGNKVFFRVVPDER